jgi:nucleoside-triphosphatase THEP1
MVAETNRLEQERDAMNAQYLADTEQLEQWVETEKERLANDANRAVEQGREEAIVAIDEVLSEMEVIASQNAELREKLQCYQLPTLPTGTSRVEVVAGRIVDFFYQKGIVADYVDSWTEHEYDLIRVKPRSGAKEQFKKLADELQLELRLDRLPTISITQGSIQIKVDSRGIDTRVKIEETTAPEPQADYLIRAVSSSASFRINGESGSGKSTLAMNLIEAMRNELGGCDVTLIDPKYPLSEWDFTPRYKGIEDAFAGLKEASSLVETRLQLAREDKETGKVIRAFKPALFVIDEIDWVVTHYGIEAANELRTTLKVGRALNVMLLYIGQTPLCSRLKMNRDDFRHSTNFYLGENIPAGIEEVVHSSALKSELESQYTLRQQGSNKYFCLIKQPGRSAFLANLPKPLNIGISESENYGTGRNWKQMEEFCGSEEVPDWVPPVTSAKYVNMVEIAVKAAAEGLSKTYIIKSVWGLTGRKYVEGLELWDVLGLSEIVETRSQ